VYAVRPSAQPGTLSILTGSWVLGWVVLPLLLGGVRGRVRPVHLRLESIPPVRAAYGLLVASALGVGPAVSLIALAALPAHAARDGSGATLIAAAGALLLWLLGLTGSAVALEAVGSAAGPVGAALTGVLTGTVMGVLGSVWAVAPWAGLLLIVGPPAPVTSVLRWTPGFWPLDGSAALLLPLALLVGVAFLAYAVLVRRVLTGAARPRSSRTARAAAGGFARGPIHGVLGRERHTWTRHPLRLQYLAFAVVYGVLLAALPLLADVNLLAPWAGVFVVLWAATMAASLVGLDGTALWLPLTAPRGERAEVLGRALAWLFLAAPAGILFTVAGILVAPEVDPVAALAVLPAVLGAGAAVPVWISVLRVRPVDDPRRPTAADNPTDIVSVLLVLVALVITAAPAFSLAVWGPAYSRWPAVAVGLVGGAAAWWGATWAATERLTRRGTEVLAAAAQTTAAPTTRLPLTWDADYVRTHKVTVWALALLTLGWIPVVPQGLMVLVFDIEGGWIVASHLAGAAHTATALGMVALGGALLLTGLVLWDRREPA
jgi:ABC-2 type transport system permease protein